VVVQFNISLFLLVVTDNLLLLVVAKCPCSLYRIFNHLVVVQFRSAEWCGAEGTAVVFAHQRFDAVCATGRRTALCQRWTIHELMAELAQ
jgi:hypothetical protein